MQHCNEGAKPLQGFGGAAPKCGDLKAEPPRGNGFAGRSPSNSARSSPWAARGLRGRAPQAHSGGPKDSAPQGMLNYAANRILLHYIFYSINIYSSPIPSTPQYLHSQCSYTIQYMVRYNVHYVRITLYYALYVCIYQALIGSDPPSFNRRPY